MNTHPTPAITPPLPGHLWPEQQGRYAGIVRSDDGLRAWHLIVPEGDEYKFTDVKWGPRKTIKGCDSRFDGHANTMAMAAAGNALAEKIRALPGDCYLPARGETALMYATMPEHCDVGWHWTSTQCSDSNAWTQNFYLGSQYYDLKSYEACCRAVRRLPLQSLDPSAGAA
ncbi:MAG TPA: hypothetical protein VE934_12125 [Polaromonas sp.]|uniref:hypothetical protein n=1 Tax=Polaromonas sp. TaxID=1869339 RepID=UPI002D3B95C7|nr:hypothetical protein [Polaromonas sp.]HYW57703.1 hypothetical protein [Polaromonas sp.]